jgi:hypothetical protein
MNELEEKLQCVMVDAGAQIGEILRCIIEAEVTSQLSKIQQLQAVLNGSACCGDVTPTT